MIHELVQTLSVQAPLLRTGCRTDPAQGSWLLPQELEIALPHALVMAPHHLLRKASFHLELNIALYG